MNTEEIFKAKYPQEVGNEVVLDCFHYHEIADRCHVINSLIDDFILSHPACNPLMNSYAVNAQSLLCAVMSEASKEEGKLTPPREGE